MDSSKSSQRVLHSQHHTHGGTQGIHRFLIEALVGLYMAICMHARMCICRPLLGHIRSVAVEAEDSARDRDAVELVVEIVEFEQIVEVVFVQVLSCQVSRSSGE